MNDRPRQALHEWCRQGTWFWWKDVKGTVQGNDEGFCVHRPLLAGIEFLLIGWNCPLRKLVNQNPWSFLNWCLMIMSCDDFKQRLPFSRWDLEFEAKHKATWPAIEPVVESCWPSFSLTGQGHNRLAGTQKGTPAIPRSLIPTSPDTSFLVTSGLTSDLPDIQSRYFYRVGSSHDSKWSEAAKWAGCRWSNVVPTWVRIINPCHTLSLSLFLSLVVWITIHILIHTKYAILVESTRRSVDLDPQKLRRRKRNRSQKSHRITSDFPKVWSFTSASTAPDASFSMAVFGDMGHLLSASFESGKIGSEWMVDI